MAGRGVNGADHGSAFFFTHARESFGAAVGIAPSAMLHTAHSLNRSRRFSPTAATLAVFIFSGIVHELAVSVPAQAGYGLPTLYFLLQAAIVLLENSAVGKQFLLGQGYRGQALTLVTVFLPLPILFHPPFVRNVMGPFLQFISNL